MSLRYGPRALADLERLHAFVASEDPVAADRVRLQLVARIEALAEQPKLGRLLDPERPVRQWGPRRTCCTTPFGARTR